MDGCVTFVPKYRHYIQDPKTFIRLHVALASLTMPFVVGSRNQQNSSIKLLLMKTDILFGNYVKMFYFSGVNILSGSTET